MMSPHKSQHMRMGGSHSHTPVSLHDNMARTIVPFSNISPSSHCGEYYHKNNKGDLSSSLVFPDWTVADLQSVLLDLCPCLDVSYSPSTRSQKFMINGRIARNDMDMFRQMLLS